MEWRDYNHEERETWPTEKGLYRVMVGGDSESIDGHVIYSFDDYATWANAKDDEDDEGNPCIRFGMGDHDEEPDFMFAYYGPINIPPYPK